MKFSVIASVLAVATAASAATVAPTAPCGGQEVVAKVNDTCESIAKAANINLVEFVKLNALEGVDCSALTEGQKYCVKTPTRVHKRNWFYKTEGLTGAKLALAKKKIASAKKVATTKKATTTTKKAVTTTKKAVTTTKKATTTTKAATSSTSGQQSKPGDDWSSTPANAPSNAVRHITPSCTKYATVDSSYNACEDFASKNGITQTQLFSWNAGLHGFGSHECDNLDDGKAYCVAV
ncbi:hypothetical protein K501DRAFT_323993 [Backusella circina FSU 941]|nr:hypothetical protein K501DRAFT_323993 [Backusella circina FSU 941]